MSPALESLDHKESAIFSRLMGSTGWLIAGRILGSVCTLLILLQLALTLPLEDFGRLTFYLAIFAVIGSLSEMGTGQTVVQQSSSGRASLAQLLRTGRQVRGFMALFCVALWSVWCFWAQEPEPMWLIASAACTLTVPFELTSIPARNAIRLRAPVLIRAGASLFALALVTGLLFKGVQRVGPLLFAISLSASVSHLAIHGLLRGHLPSRASKGVALRPYLWLTLPLGVGALCQQLYFWIDNAFIRHAMGEAELGLYNLPVRLFSFAILVAVLAPQAALPWLSRANEEGNLGPAIARLGTPLLTFGLFGASFIAFAGTELLLCFGPEFERSTKVLRILVIALFLVHAGALWITALISAGWTHSVLWLGASGLLVNGIGNAILLPRMGIEGAAVATVATEGWVAMAALAGLIRMGANPLRHLTWRALISFPLAAALGYGLAQIARPLLRMAVELR